MIGIHTPEFEHERDREQLREVAQRHGLAGHPQLLDDDGAYWRALGNHYWPTLYLVDRCGRLRFRHEGEAHAGQPSGQALERQIEGLLAEPGC